MSRASLGISGVVAGICLMTAIMLSGCAGSRKAALSPTEGMGRELAAAGKNVEMLSAKDSRAVTRAVAKTYRPWQQVSLRGKAKMAGLPVSLGVKIYMERGSSVVMSLNAPLLGEVGRVEIDADSILLVNKRSKTYCTESLEKPLAAVGADITNLQDLLLGRVFILGSGTLSEGNAPQIEVSDGASDTWILTPKVQPERAQYGFTLYKDGQMLLAVAGTPDERYMASATYSYDKSDTDIELSIKAAGKTIDLDLSLNAPDYSPTPLERIGINPKWEKLDFRNWLKSF